MTSNVRIENINQHSGDGLHRSALRLKKLASVVESKGWKLLLTCISARVLQTASDKERVTDSRAHAWVFNAALSF